MMINPIKIKDNYKNSQKSSLNVTVNSVINQNMYLNHINLGNQNINSNGDIFENKDRNKDQINNCKYNHLPIFKDYRVNDRINDEPIKVINIFK